MDNFNVICRTCNAERSNLVNLSSTAPGNESLLLRDVLFIVCPSLPTQMCERLPQQICYFCSKQLELAYKFQLQCKKSYEEQWNLIEAKIKKEASPVLTLIKDENIQSSESSNLSAEEEYEDEEEVEEASPPVLEENLEFLDEEETEESEDVSAVLVTPEESETTVPETYTENNDRFICCHCNKKFFTQKGLLLHEKLAHKNLKPILLKAEILTIECKYCLQVFEKKSQLLRHCQQKHSKEVTTDLTCHICQKAFLDKNRFKHHLLYHEKKEYLCTVKDCNRSFIIKYKLTDHLKRFHGIILNNSEIRALQSTST